MNHLNLFPYPDADWKWRKQKTQKSDLFLRNLKLHCMRLNWIESKTGRKTKLQFWLSKKHRQEERQKPTHKNAILIHSDVFFLQSFFIFVAFRLERFLRFDVILQQPQTPPKLSNFFALLVFVHNLQYMQLKKIRKRGKKLQKKREIIIFLDRLCRVPFRCYNLLWAFFFEFMMWMHSENNNKQMSQAENWISPRWGR